MRRYELTVLRARPVGPTVCSDQLLGDQWIHFCKGYLEVYLFFNSRSNFFVKNNRGTSLIGDVHVSCDR